MSGRLCNGIAFTLLLWLWPLHATSLANLQPNQSADLLIRVAAEDNWPPFSDQQGLGLSYQLVTAALAPQGYRLELSAVPYARALHLTSLGKADALWNVTRQNNTSRDYILHDTPLFQASSSFYYHGQAKAYRSVAEIPDNTVVGVILGYEYGDLYEQHKHRFKRVEVSQHRQLIQLLQQERVALAIFFDDVLQWYLQQEPVAGSLPVRGQLNHVSEIFVALNKQSPRSKTLALALDQGLARLKQDGEYQRLMQLYLPEGQTLPLVLQQHAALSPRLLVPQRTLTR